MKIDLKKSFVLLFYLLYIVDLQSQTYKFKDFNTINLLVFLCVMLYSKAVYNYVLPSDMILCTSLVFSIIPMISKQRNIFSLFLIIICFLWQIDFLAITETSLIVLGVLSWCRFNYNGAQLNELTDVNFVKNVIHILPLVIIPTLSIYFTKDFFYLYFIFFLYVLFLLLYFKGNSFETLFNIKNSNSSTLGLLFCMSGLIVFVVGKV